jgi:hypothetical protein
VCCAFSEEGGNVRIPAHAMELLGARDGATVGFTVLKAPGEKKGDHTKRPVGASA